MTDRPIIFSGPMVLALLGGRKTMTRRMAWKHDGDPRSSFSHKPSPWQLAKPGDCLWVRESLKNSQAGWTYAADDWLIEMPPRDPRVPAMIAWAHHKEGDSAPSIHMPRWASRLTLIVTATKIERVQDISEADAIAEGACRRPDGYWTLTGDLAAAGADAAQYAFRMLWSDLHGNESWDDNPECVCLSFRVVKANIDADVLPKLANAGSL